MDVHMKSGALAFALLAALGGGRAEAQLKSWDRQECPTKTCVAPETTGGGLAVAYPKALQAQGVQGKAMISFTVGLDGVASDIVVEQSSRSPDLDAASIAAVQGHTFKPGTVDSKPTVMRRQLPFEFQKDSMKNLSQKTCADVTADVAYFRTAFSELPIEQMWLNKLSQAQTTMLIDMSKLDAKGYVAVVKRNKAAFGSTVEWCASNPDANYFEHFVSLTQAPA